MPRNVPIAARACPWSGASWGDGRPALSGRCRSRVPSQSTRQCRRSSRSLASSASCVPRVTRQSTQWKSAASSRRRPLLPPWPAPLARRRCYFITTGRWTIAAGVRLGSGVGVGVDVRVGVGVVVTVWVGVGVHGGTVGVGALASGQRGSISPWASHLMRSIC